MLKDASSASGMLRGRRGRAYELHGVSTALGVPLVVGGPPAAGEHEAEIKQANFPGRKASCIVRGRGSEKPAGGGGGARGSYRISNIFLRVSKIL